MATSPPPTPAAPSTDPQPSPVRASSRLKVAIDVDEVLGRFVYALCVFCEQQYGMSHSVTDFFSYEFAKVWGCDSQRSQEIVHAFLESPHFNDGIPVIPGAYESLQRLKRVCDLVVVTSRQHAIREQTLRWINEHYPDTFQDIQFGGHYGVCGNIKRSKSQMCLELGASVLVDDNPGYALDCARAGVKVLLYDENQSYPWSKLDQDQEHPLITVAHNWQDVERHILELVAQHDSAQQEAAGPSTVTVSHPATVSCQTVSCKGCVVCKPDANER